MAMGWIAPAAAALIAAASAPLVGQTAEATGATDVEILELDRERYRRLTVPVSIGEHGPFDFMVDTGAQATVLSIDIADRLGILEREPALLIGMASRMPIEVARLRNFALGTRVFDIEIAPLVAQANIGGADGILGLDSLQDQRVLLDFERRTMAVADAEQLGGNSGFEITVKARRELGQLIITHATLDGVRVNVVVDTGAQGSVGNLKLQKRLRGRSAGTTEMTDINGVKVSGDTRMAREIQIGRLSLTNVPIAFVDSPTFKALGLNDEPAMVLGMNELRLFRRVAIDFKERKVLFDLPKGANLNNNTIGSVFNF
jgi:predicted aspartyl protease